MQKKDSNNINQKLVDKLINVAYGDAGLIDRFYVVWKASQNKTIKNLLEEYKNTAKVVHCVKNEDVPIQLTQIIKHKTFSKEQPGFFISKISSLFYLLLGKRAITAAVFGIILTIIVSFLIFREPVPAHKYSRTEIDLAKKQFKLSMAIIGKAFEKAEKSFTDEILDKQVNQKLSRGYYLVNNILIGG